MEGIFQAEVHHINDIGAIASYLFFPSVFHMRLMAICVSSPPKLNSGFQIHLWIGKCFPFYVFMYKSDSTDFFLFSFATVAWATPSVA